MQFRKTNQTLINKKLISMNTQQENNTLSLREEAMHWWNNLDSQEKERYFDGYAKFTMAENPYQLTEGEIQNIWAVITTEPEPKEQPTTVSVEENIDDYPPVTGNDVKYEGELLVDDKTSVSVEEAAKEYLKKIDEETGTMWTEDNDEIVKHFASFAIQQGVQDKAIIGELLEVISRNIFDGKIKLNLHEQSVLITKAKQHLNQ